MRVIAFTGMPGAGKSLAVELAHDEGIPVLRMGDAVWDEVNARGLQLTNAEVGRVATEMRREHGAGIWAERTVMKAKDVDAPLIIIDGLRTVDEIEIFRKAFGEEFTLVAILASPDTRFMRLLDRKRADDVASREEFDARDARERAWGIEKAIAMADLTIENEGHQRDLRRAVEDLFMRHDASTSGPHGS
ncbi:MAG: AAA family ATPase [Thermoplasmatota archaeon]